MLFAWLKLLLSYICSKLLFVFKEDGGNLYYEEASEIMIFSNFLCEDVVAHQNSLVDRVPS